jgi:single-strand DNA-binding protein
MTDINSLVIIGRLTRDAELKYTKGGTAVLAGSIAVGRSIPPGPNGGEWKNETSFFDFQLFGKSAETATKWAKKGKQIAIKGEIRQDRWEQDGQPRSKVYIVCEKIQPLSDPKGSGARNGEDETEGGWESQSTRPAPNPHGYAPKPPQQAPTIDPFDDDIPF